MNNIRKPYYGRSHTPRTRSGCLRCRLRKLKCDEQKPRCQRCRNTSQCCQYGLKLTWKNETLSAGAKKSTCRSLNPLPHIRARQNSTLDKNTNLNTTATHSSPMNVWAAFLNTSTEDLFLYNNSSHGVTNVHITDAETDKGDYDDIETRHSGPGKHENTSLLFSAFIKLSSPLRPSQLELSSIDSILLDFYINGMCSTCSLLDGRDNGYKHVILPMSINSALLMKSVLAVSANHLRFLDIRYHITALQYRGSTLKSLQQVISTPNTVSKSELLSTILMLCFFDISDGCQSDWIKHLKGARRIMMQPSATRDNPSDSAALTFLAQYFASHNIMAYTALADPRKEKALQAGGIFWLKQIIRPEQEIDGITGCSKALLSIILDISCRIREARNPRTTHCAEARSDNLAWKHSMELRLQILEQHVSPSSYTTSAAAARLRYTAAAFRDAALVLLQYLDPQLFCLSNATTRQRVTSILSLLDKCSIDASGSRSSSLWPFFIAACHVESDEERLFVLKRFHSMESRKRFGNITPVREVVECMWRRCDLRADDVGGKERGYGNYCFEWEDAMALLGSNLSLT